MTILALIGAVAVLQQTYSLLRAMFFTDYGPSMFSTPWGRRY
jgi:hypothetical protein